MQLQNKMPQKNRNKVFGTKEATNKAESKIFRGFEVGRKVRAVFPKPKNKIKG